MKALITTAVILLLSGCASMDGAMSGGSSAPSKEDRQKTVASFPELSKDQQDKFIDGKPWIGMTDSELKGMWNATPQKTQEKLTARGNEQVRLYHLRVGDWKTGVVSKYYRVNMVEGKLVELQELDPRAGSFDKL